MCNLEKFPFYRKVGEATAEMLEAGGVQPDLIHSIGVSLGAHGAASLGHRMGGRIRRLTGLDPAGPTFHGITANNRFDKSAAHFVDVIHTAGKWVGNDDVLGHVDFFANTGRAPQPGCEQETVDLKCSHLRVRQLLLFPYNLLLKDETFQQGMGLVFVDN